MDVNLIRNLEIKYHNLIWEIVGGNNFKDSLTEMQETMRRDHEEIAQNYFKTNVVEILFERITRYFIYRHNSINFKNPYHSPISSDIAFETDDAIIFIDCKTVDMNDRPGKGNKIDYPVVVFNINQCTFKNINVYINSAEFEDGSSFDNFEGVVFPNNLTTNTKEGIFKNKPILTYILGLHYYPADPNPEDFSITDPSFEKRELYLVCLPHFHTAFTDFNNNLVTKFKFYDWVDTPGENEKYPNHIPISTPKPNFKKFRWIIDNGPGEDKSNGNYYFYDDSLMGPLGTIGTVWNKKGNKYEALINGKTPRIRKNLFTNNPHESWRISTNKF